MPAVLLLIAHFIPQRVGIYSLGEVFPCQVVVRAVFKVVVCRPPLCAVAQAQLLYHAGIAVLVPCRAGIHAQPPCKVGIGGNPDHSLDRSIVFRARIGNHLDAFDVNRRETVELRQIVYATIVNKEHGLPPAHNIVSAFGLSHKRHRGQHIFEPAGMGQSRATYFVAEAAGSELRHRARRPDRNLAQLMLRLDESDGHRIAIRPDHGGLIAQARHGHHPFAPGPRHHKPALCIAHTAIDVGRVGTAKHYDCRSGNSIA